MPIIVKALNSEFENPDEGNHHVRISKVEDLGMIKSEHGTNEKVAVLMDTEQLDKQGKPRKIYRRFNKTIHAKSALRKFVKGATGEDPDREFDLESLLGQEFDVIVEHNEHDGRVFANISAIIRPKSIAKAPAAQESK
jgi:hypothetical protein